MGCYRTQGAARDDRPSHHCAGRQAHGILSERGGLGSPPSGNFPAATPAPRSAPQLLGQRQRSPRRMRPSSWRRAPCHPRIALLPAAGQVLQSGGTSDIIGTRNGLCAVLQGTQSGRVAGHGARMVQPAACPEHPCGLSARLVLGLAALPLKSACCQGRSAARSEEVTSPIGETPEWRGRPVPNPGRPAPP
jgi:hypothetical protein